MTLMEAMSIVREYLKHGERPTQEQLEAIERLLDACENEF